MVKEGIESFKGKKVLLLQGSVGPFFKHLAFDLHHIGATVHKINFNGGDWFFSSRDAINFRGKFEEWPQFFTDFIEKYQIEIIILFGDCRKYHRIAHAIADKKGIEIGVFEEGYIRPDYITFEKFGVNGHSQIPRDPIFYQSLSNDEFTVTETSPIGSTFRYAAWWATLYYFYSALLYPIFQHYSHHRPLNPFEGLYWIRSVWRKQWYRYVEFGIDSDLITIYKKKYFLVPLQISTDAQIVDHSDFRSVEHFLEKVIASFAEHASTETLLVIKHHPLDRGYNDYNTFIHRISGHHNIRKRVHYIHDQHLPTLLEHARGAIMINSTVGLSAIHHNCPLKVCGTAIYDLEGLTYQGSMDQFWDESINFQCDRELYKRFNGYIINHKQINGSFYRKLKNADLECGIFWSLV
ncbi:MAG: capsular biosynthesis protein [Sulfurimonas sp.]